MAAQCDIRPRHLLDLVDELASRLLENLSPTQTLFKDHFGEYLALQRIEQVVTKQCKKVGKINAGIFVNAISYQQKIG